MSKVFRISRIVLIAVALVLSACGSRDPAPDRSDGTVPPESSQPSATQPTGTGVAPLPISLDDPVGPAGTLRLGFGGTVALDPTTASPASAGDMVVSDLLYDTLTVLDANGRPQPGLATFSTDEDQMVWRFDIVENATFADGTPITANDVRQSLERVTERGGSSLAALRLGNVESIGTVGSATVEITLAEPSALVPEVLSSPLYGITDATTVATYAGGAIRPNPSGDFVVEAQAETELVLSRRSGTGPEKVLIDIFATDSAAFDAFVGGDVDWAPVPGDRFEEAISLGGTDGLVPFNGGLYLAIDPGRAPLDDRELRRALALSVDRVALVDQVYGPAAQPLLGVVPAGVTIGAVDECRGPCGPNRAAARPEVERVFPDGQERPLRLLVDDSTSMRAVGNVLGEQIEASGFDVEVSSEDAVTYEQVIAAGQQQMFVFGWLGVAATPAEYLLPLFHSASADNVTGYANEGVDAQIDAARTQLDPQVREQIWAEVERVVLDDAVIVPLVQFRTASVVSDRVDGLKTRVDGTLDLTGVTIADV